MMFKGTAKRSALDITYSMGNIGAQSNAYTSEECTVFYAAIVSQYFSQMQEILCDMLRPSLDQHEFDTEKKVILEEISLYMDRPQSFFFERATKDFFLDHPAGQSVLGTLESVSAIQRDDMLDYFNRRYVPNNMVLVCAGNFSWDKMVEDAEKYCGSWKAQPVSRKLLPYQPPKIKKEYYRKDLNQAHLLYMTGSSNVISEDRFAFDVLSMILGDYVGSKMYWKLVDTGLVESATCDTDEKDDVGCFYAYAIMEPEKIQQVSEIVYEIISKPLDFSDDELERAKIKLASRVVLSGEVPMARMNAIGSGYLARKKVEPLSAIEKRIRSVTRDDIASAIGKYGFGTWSEFRMLPEK